MKRNLTVKELAHFLNAYLSCSMISDYCPNGLQVEAGAEVKKIATAVSANLATIEKAIEEKVDVLIVHHGIFWSGDDVPILGTKSRKIGLLLKHEISLFGYHLPLDMHQDVGNNWRAARDLGFEKISPFGLYKGLTIGVKGEFTSCSFEEFVKKLETYYQHPATVASGGKKIVRSAALVSGGAHQLISKAAQEEVDCFITGNFDEPTWSSAFEEKINFCALGHHATERVGPKALGEYLQTELKIPSIFIDVPNPF